MICGPLIEPEPLAIETAPRPTVLIVDDDADMVEVLATRLQRQGFATLTDDQLQTVETGVRKWLGLS